MVDVPYFAQETDWTCGPACVRMVLAANGIVLPEPDLAARLRCDVQEGTHSARILEMLAAYGLPFSVRADASIDQLRTGAAEGIVLVGVRIPWDDEGHFALVRSVGVDAVSMQDPRYGAQYTLGIEPFLDRWRMGLRHEPLSCWMVSIPTSR